MKNKIWMGTSADCIGPLHIRQNLPMQDSCRIKFFSDGFVATVSDGLGSWKHSEFGSNEACKIFVRQTRIWIKRGATSPEKLLRTFHRIWLKKIENSGRNARDCEATFLAAVCTKNWLFLFRLGDGMIVALSDDKSKNLLFSDLKSESFSNITHCLKKEFKISDWEIQKIAAKNIKCVFLCTDGISDDLQDGVAFRFVSDLALQYAGLTKKQIATDMKKWILNWPVPRHSDDKTAVFIQRKQKF